MGRAGGEAAMGENAHRDFIRFYLRESWEAFGPKVRTRWGGKLENRTEGRKSQRYLS